MSTPRDKAHWVTYGHEHEDRLRVGFLGCGGHSFRNVLPMLRYLPVDLVAVCDLDASRSEAFGATFGAARSHTDYRDMIDAGDLDAVLIVTGYDERGRVRHADLAAACLERGLSTWVEKPPVNDLDDIDMLRQAIAAGGGPTYAVGFKKAFAPANRKLKALTDDPAFGAVRTVSVRYAQTIPTIDEMRAEPPSRARLGFLDHICHPVSLLRMLCGPAKALRYERTDSGSGFVTFHFDSGAIATLLLAFGLSMRAVTERTEVNGDGATAIVENNTRVLLCPNVYRRQADGAFGPSKGFTYGRDPDFTGLAADAQLVWEPEFSLGQLYNKAEFILGYFAELEHFFDAVANKEPVTIGGLDYAEEGIRIFDAFREPPGQLVELR